METDLPVLTSTRCLIKHCLPDVELLHVMYRVNDLLDDFSIDCTIVDAYKRTGTVILMQYVAAREDPNEMNVFYRRWLFNAATELVAGNGDLESLQWLMESYLPDEFLTKAVAAAATNGHLSILQWLFENHHDRGYWGHTEMCGALTHGHTEVVEWLREHAVPRAECLMEVMDTAAVSGCLSIAKWLAEKRLTCDADTWMRLQGDMDEVCWGNWELPAKDGALEFLKFLDSYSIGGPMYSGEPYGTLERAAWSGHLEVVKWLHSKFDLPLTPCAMSSAARNGHFHVVGWLYENGCEGCDYAIAAAAASGRLDMVKWLHDIGLQVTDEVAICNAVEYGHLDVVRWLGQHYKEWCDGMPALLDDAAIKGRLDIVQCLHEDKYRLHKVHYD